MVPKTKGKPRGKPFQKGDPRAGRPKGVQNKVTLEVREAARALVEDPEYRERFEKRLKAGELPPMLEAMVWHYAYGKPKETVEHTGKDGVPLLDGAIVVEVGRRVEDGNAA